MWTTWLRVGDGDALGGGEQGRVARHEADVFVLQQRPDVGDVVPAQRRRGAQLRARRIRIAGVEVGGAQWKSGLNGEPSSSDPAGSRIRHIAPVCLRSCVYSRPGG